MVRCGTGKLQATYLLPRWMLVNCHLPHRCWEQWMETIFKCRIFFHTIACLLILLILKDGTLCVSLTEMLCLLLWIYLLDDQNCQKFCACSKQTEQKRANDMSVVIHHFATFIASMSYCKWCVIVCIQGMHCLITVSVVFTLWYILHWCLAEYNLLMFV